MGDLLIRRVILQFRRAYKRLGVGLTRVIDPFSLRVQSYTSPEPVLQFLLPKSQIAKCWALGHLGFLNLLWRFGLSLCSILECLGWHAGIGGWGLLAPLRELEALARSIGHGFN